MERDDEERDTCRPKGLLGHIEIFEADKGNGQDKEARDQRGNKEKESKRVRHLQAKRSPWSHIKPGPCGHILNVARHLCHYN